MASLVLFDVVEHATSASSEEKHFTEPSEYGVYARVGETDAGLVAVYQSKDAATALAKHLAGSKANYGKHCDGPSGWVPNVPFN